VALAVTQLQLNWDSTVESRLPRGELWMGRFLKMVSRTWPRFRVVVIGGEVTWEGAPPIRPGQGAIGGKENRLAQRYSRATHERLWRERQVSILSAKPTKYKQDYFLLHFLCVQNDISMTRLDGPPLSVDEIRRLSVSPVFIAKFNVSTIAVRTCLRFLAGLEDFARTNGHWKRRRSHSQYLSVEATHRLCLACLARRQLRMLDSEWHALFECPFNATPRALFAHKYPLSQFGYIGSNSCPVDCLVQVVAQARSDERFLDEFAFWVVGTLACRRREFRLLAS
jgi:hypothetical protein